MNKIVVVYQSKYGSTKKYAQWLSEELSCEIIKRNNVKPVDLEQYDTIIYGGGLYGGGVSGIDLLTKNFDELKHKNIVLFTCGLADPMDNSNTKNIKNELKKVLPSQLYKEIKIFHLRGGIDYSKLGFMHKTMMAMFYKIMKKKDYDTLRKEDKQMLATYGKAVDFKDKTTITPLIEYVQGL